MQLNGAARKQHTSIVRMRINGNSKIHLPKTEKDAQIAITK